MAPASRTTSPPIVVGRKLLANKPVNVSAVDSDRDIFTLPERRSTYQRSATKHLEISTKARLQMILVTEICFKALMTSLQPPSCTSTIMSTIARTVPASRNKSGRSFKNRSIMGVLRRYGLADRIGQLLLRFMIRAGQQLCYQSHQDRLEAQDQDHDGQLKQRRAQHGYVLQVAPDEQVDERKAPGKDQGRAGAGEQAHWLIRVAE